MRRYLTDAHRVFAESTERFHRNDRAEMDLVVCLPAHTRQQVIGFGGALTESSAYVFAGMPPDVQDQVMRLCFGGAAQGGNAYSLCRTHIQSCDFSLGNYAYVRPFDRQLTSFSIDRDRQLLLPFIQCALAANPALELFASPWSPPGFMKTNRLMNGGGRLRERFYDAWARLLARYVSAYAREGVQVGRLSIQNEPMARQTWDSCLFTPEEEAAFAVGHLRPALDAAGHEDVKLFAWDHNTDRLLDRVDAVFAYPGAAEAFDGVAFHWYAGDHFEQVEAVAAAHPTKELLFTEGCVEYSRDVLCEATQERKAEQYAHALIGHLNAGAQGFIDWNVLLDERGGPNHVGNFCEAPLMFDRAEGRLVVNRSFHYLGHVSRFVRPGARRFLVSRSASDLECAGFVNPEGDRVLVVLNRTDHTVRCEVVERPFAYPLEMPAHSIVTLVWDAEEVSV